MTAPSGQRSRTHADRRRREMHDPPKQRLVFAAGHRAKHRIAVSSERLVDLRPSPPRGRCRRASGRISSSSVRMCCPVERRVGVEGRCKLRGSVRAARSRIATGHARGRESSFAGLVFGMQAIEQRPGTRKPQTRT